MIHQLTLLPLHQKRPGRWAWLQKWHQTACHSWPWTRTEMLDFSIWGLEQAIHLFAWESWLQNWQFSSQLHCCPTTRSRAPLNRSANLKPTSWTYLIHPLTVQRDFVHECYKQNLWKGQPYSPKLTGTYTTPTEKKKPEENQAGSIVQWPGEMLTSVQHALSTEMFPYSVSDDYKSLNREGVTPQQLKKIHSKPNLAHWSGFTRHQCF